MQRELEQEFKEEQGYLHECLAYIKTLQEQLNQKIASLTGSMQEIKADAYDEHMEYKSGANMADNAVVQHELWQQHLYQADLVREQRNLARLSWEPYFATLTFRFANEDEAETYHLGLSSLFDDETYRQWVIDWRSPIASLYYEGELGPASYDVNGEKVSGELLNKKQILIRKGHLLSIYNRSNLMNDRLLEWVLSQPASQHLQQIVSTIQSEQNSLIRAHEKQNLLIYGVAGSGKSSIALHRVSYLLYLHRDWNSSSFLFISPNEQFAEYISELLPNLNDENISTLTLANLYRSLFLHKQLKLAQFDFIEVAGEIKSIFANFSFADCVQAFVANFSKSDFQAHDLLLDDLKVESETLTNLYQHEFASEAAFQRPALIFSYLKKELNANAFNYQADEIRSELQSMLQCTDLVEILKQFYQSQEFKAWLKSLTEQEAKLVKGKCQSVYNKLDEIDRIVLAYFLVAFYRDYDTYLIKHLLIDEAQDLLAIEHILLGILFKVDKTICADFNQAIYWPQPKNFAEQLKAYYAEQKQLLFRQISVAYRSSYEITDFCRRFIKNTELQAVKRHGSEVKVIKLGDKAKTDKYAGILPYIESVYNAFLQSANERHSLAIIVPDEAWRKELLTELKAGEFAFAVLNAEQAKEKQSLITALSEAEADVDADDNEYKEFKLAVHTARSAKGMEFDTVFVYPVDKKYYQHQQANLELYVACSRALHNLQVFYYEDASLLNL